MTEARKIRCRVYILRIVERGDKMRSRFIGGDVFAALLLALMPANALACEVSARYGMRIGDVLALRREDVAKGRFTYKEQKTGKPRRVTMSPDIQRRLLAQSGRVWVFEHRTDWRKHRTRQAVYKDIKRIAKAFRVDNGVSPHSARKLYAVNAYKRSGGDLARVKRLLNHSNEAVTMLYALADTMGKPVAKRKQVCQKRDSKK